MNPLVYEAFSAEAFELQKEARLWSAINRATGTTRRMLDKGWTVGAKGTDEAGQFLRAAEGPGKELLQHGGRWWTPGGALHRVGQGLRSAGRTLDPRTGGRELRKGWQSAGQYKMVGGKMVNGKMVGGVPVEVGAGVGTKALTAGFTGLGLHGAAKKGPDPTQPNAGRAERWGKAIGSGAGFIGGMRGGMISSMVAGGALGAVGGGVGKVVDGAGRLVTGRPRPAAATAKMAFRQAYYRDEH